MLQITMLHKHVVTKRFTKYNLDAITIHSFNVNLCYFSFRQVTYTKLINTSQHCLKGNDFAKMIQPTLLACLYFTSKQDALFSHKTSTENSELRKRLIRCHIRKRY